MAITNIYKGVLERSDINKIYKGTTLLWEKQTTPPPTNVVVFKSDGPRTITPIYTNSGVTLQYSVDKGSTWTTIASESATESSREHWFRGQATGTKSLFTSSAASNAWTFSDSSNLKGYGNLNFLLCDTLGDEVAPTTLANYSYAYMFNGCTSLTTPPELPATTLANYCYRSMFNGCSSLTTAPELPATTMASSCYYNMFSGCSSLTTPPPVLPANTMANSSCRNMFNGCSSLTTPPELPATTLADYCYTDMFTGCSSLTTAPELPATTMRSYCYSTMFSGCTSLTTPPRLPATTLSGRCYQRMFEYCTALTTVPKLPAIQMQERCYEYMFLECSALNVSQTKTGSYIHPWRFPTTGTGKIKYEWGTEVPRWNAGMLQATGIYIPGYPTINTTYYVENQPV